MEARRRGLTAALDTAATSELKAKLDVERRQTEDERRQLLGDARVAREHAEQMVRDATMPEPEPGPSRREGQDRA